MRQTDIRHQKNEWALVWRKTTKSSVLRCKEKLKAWEEADKAGREEVMKVKWYTTLRRAYFYAFNRIVNWLLTSMSWNLKESNRWAPTEYRTPYVQKWIVYTFRGSQIWKLIHKFKNTSSTSAIDNIEPLNAFVNTFANTFGCAF